MITINKARKLGGPTLRSTSDSEVQNLINQFYSLAELVCEQVKKSGSKKQLKVIDRDKKERQNGVS